MTTSTTAPAELAEVVQQEMERWAVPGMTVGVLHEGAIEAWGFGVTNIETGCPVLPDTLFQIGSISKVFTATAIMQLVDEGKLDLDAPVSRALPSFELADAAALAAVTPRHLLTHMTGFYGDKFKDFGPGDDALARAMADFTDLRQITAPGEAWSYCNTGFQALGAILEHHLDMPVEQAITARVLKPLGLTHSTFWPHEAITYSTAAGHNKLPEQDLEVARPYPLMRCMNAAGGIIGTVSDLLRFARFHLGDGTVEDGTHVLSEVSVRTMQQPQVEGGLADHWGLGWAISIIDGATVIGHGGSTNGFRARLSIVPDQRMALAFLTNGSAGGAAYRTVETALLKTYAGLRRQDPPSVTVPAEILACFAGRYETPTNDVTVTVDGDSLDFDVISKSPLTGKQITLPTAHARPIGPRRFVISDGELAGSWADFLPADAEPPRFLRWGGRLADRVG